MNPNEPPTSQQTSTPNVLWTTAQPHTTGFSSYGPVTLIPSKRRTGISLIDSNPSLVFHYFPLTLLYNDLFGNKFLSLKVKIFYPTLYPTQIGGWTLLLLGLPCLLLLIQYYHL